MTPEEQARRLVEEWVAAYDLYPLAQDRVADLVRRLVPLIARAALADEIERQSGWHPEEDALANLLDSIEFPRRRGESVSERTIRMMGDLRAKVKCAEAERDEHLWTARARKNQLDAAQATVVQLREALKGVVRVADRKTREFDTAWAALAATEEKP